MSLVLLMGLPCAGKSTICAKLAESMPSITVFSFDEMIGRRLENFQAHAERKTVEEKIRNHLKENPNKIIVADDNFYLRSMRRPFKRMARPLGVGYMVIFVPCELEEALRRNKMRTESDRVDEKSIRRMNDEMEVTKDVECFVNISTTIHLIENIPIPPKPESSLISPACCENTSNSVEMEKILRSLVSELVKNGFDGKRLSKAKKNVFEDVKHSHLLSQEELKKRLIRCYGEESN